MLPPDARLEQRELACRVAGVDRRLIALTWTPGPDVPAALRAHIPAMMRASVPQDQRLSVDDAPVVERFCCRSWCRSRDSNSDALAGRGV